MERRSQIKPECPVSDNNTHDGRGGPAAEVYQRGDGVHQQGRQEDPGQPGGGGAGRAAGPHEDRHEGMCYRVSSSAI